MDLLSVTASIITVLQLSAKVLAYLNDVKDASKDRAKCAVEASNVHSLLTNLRFRLEEARADAPWFTAVRALGIENGPLDQFKQALEALQTKITDGGRLKKAGEALVWKFKKEEIASILDRIERLKTLVEVVFQMDHFKLSQAIKDDTNFVRTHVLAIESGVDNIQHEQADAKHSKLLEWVSPTDYPAQQTDIIRRRQQGTGQWFLDAPEFATWLSMPKGTLFCPGMPGAGKTMVAAIAIEYLLKSVQSSSVGVAYVYCNYKAQEEQDASSMLAAIVKQLVQGRPSIAEPVARLHKQHADQGTKPCLEETFGALRDVKYSTVYVVIDALDECRDGDGTRSRLLARLKDLQVGQDVRIMATARFIPEIEAEFQTAMKLEIQASDEDVRRYVAGQTHRLPRCIQRDPALQATIQDKLVEAVDGMFLLARLHTESLLDKRTTKEVKSTLDRFSKGSAALNDAYDEALQRIDGQLDGDKELAKKVLSWVTYARRPLTTAELCCALAVERDGTELDPENVPDIEDLLSVCAGLIVVDQESAIVRIVHYTTQEYFERIRDTWCPNAPLHIASACLTYLSFDRFKTGSCSSDEEFEERLRESKFLDYAAKHWGEHVAEVQSDACTLTCSFLSNSCLVSSATQAFLVPTYKHRHYSQEYPQDSTGAHLAVRFGLSLILEAMLLPEGHERKLELAKKDSQDQTLLYIAAANGHGLTAELLIDKGAEVNAQGGYYGNALQAALVGTHESTVRILVERGAHVGLDVQLKGAMHHVLNNASCTPSLVRLLQQYGAPLDTTDVNNMSPLHYCVKFGHKTMARQLIDAGVPIDLRVHRQSWPSKVSESSSSKEKLSLPASGSVVTGLTPLHFAALTGNLTMTEFLLKHGADPNALSDYGETPLHLTLRTKLCGTKYRDDWTDLYLRVESLWDLLEFEEDNVNAVLAEISVTREGVFNALLSDPRTSLTVTDHKGESPLHCIRYGKPESATLIRKLVFRGADQFNSNLSQQSPLHFASKSGDNASVKALLLLGAKVASTDEHSLNALHYAAQSGNHETIITILETDEARAVDLIASKDKYGQNVLHHMLSTHSIKRVETVRWLRDQGAHISELDDSGISPLARFIKSSTLRIDIEICRSLLEIKENASFIDCDGRRLGHLCARTADFGVRILNLLFEHGVDLVKRDRDGRTVLHHAAICGSLTEQSLEFLTKIVGIQADEEDTCGRTALQYATELAAKDRSRRIWDFKRWDRTRDILQKFQTNCMDGSCPSYA
ncbi:hypothetical protein DPSP01_006977 [Paraphaeosphaeria sporulosa]